MAHQNVKVRKPQRIRPDPQPQDSVAAHCGTAGLTRSVILFGAGIAIGALGLVGIQALRARSVSPTTAAAASKPIPASYYDLLAMSPGQLAALDIAVINLLCATGLPAAENVDIPGVLRKLDEWTARVKSETQRHLYRVNDPRYAEHYDHSEARLRAEMLVQVLQQDCGVHYNPDRIYTPDFRNSKDSFLHGLVGSDNGGTCASMPVMYVAVGRRLGYPIKLVATDQHLFCRWEDAKERFNIEGSSQGGVSYHPDEFYRTWPRKISEAELRTGEFLKSFTATEELASFLLQRGMCLFENGRRAEARAALAEAHALMPESLTLQGALWWMTHGESAQRSATKRHASPRPDEIDSYIRSLMPPDPRAGDNPAGLPRPSGPVPSGPGSP